MNETDPGTMSTQPIQTAPITNLMSVAEINQKHPQCMAVFNKYGMGGCGGEAGPPEPLFIFAAAHHIPLKELVDELNQAARGEWKSDSKPDGETTATPNEVEQGETLYKRFIAAALFIALTVGTLWGVINITRIGMHQSFDSISGAVKQAHGHEQIFGWVGLFIMGMAFHAVPRFKLQTIRPLWAAKVCFALMVAGLLLRAMAQPFAETPAWGLAWILSAAAELVAISLFAGLIVRVVVRSEQKSEFYEEFIWASVGWLMVLAVWNLALTIQVFSIHSNTFPALADALFVHVALFGFISNMIFGFSMRVLPHFLGLRDTKVWTTNAAFWLWNAAIALRCSVFVFPTAMDDTAWTASGFELVAIVFYIWALGIWAKRRVKIEIKGVDNAFSWFLHLAFGWLVIAAILPFHADLFRITASGRHTMAVGFIASMILGVAYRVLPIFNGVNLHSARAMRVSFWFMAIGSSLALAMAFSSVFEVKWAFLWAAASGYLVFTAVGIFAWNIAMTLRTKAEKFTRESAVKLNTRITEILQVWPELRPVIIHGGISGLGRMRNNPPSFVTVEFAARRHSIDPQPLIDLLNKEIEKRKI